MAPDEIGIAAIGAYLPERAQDNQALIERFEFAPDFLEAKIGVTGPRKKAEDQETSDLCLRAFEDLQQAHPFDPASLDLIVVVTQNPDGHGLPHTSAIVHKKLKLPKTCFAFDVSLGCSGFVAGLAIVKGYMQTTGAKRVVLFTADPYSKVIDEDDRNTVLLFGDGATATLIEPGAAWRIGAFDMGTEGQRASALEVGPEGKLAMNGRAVFDFCAMNVPGSVKRALEANGVTKEEVDRFVLHPGSKYIADVLATRIGIPASEFPATYGNTVSSSLPLILKTADPQTDRTVLLSGFGVGLGWATTVLRTQ